MSLSTYAHCCEKTLETPYLHIVGSFSIVDGHLSLQETALKPQGYWSGWIRDGIASI